MATPLSSLRVTSEIDASGFARGAAQIVTASKTAGDAAKALGTSLASIDAGSNTVESGVKKMSRTLLDGYSATEKFEKQVRNIGFALDQGKMPLDRANALLDALYQKTGLAADAQQLAAAGFKSIVPAVDQLNNKYAELIVNAARAAEAQEEIGRRAAVVAQQIQTAQSMQSTITANIGGRGGIGAGAMSGGSVYTEADFKGLSSIVERDVEAAREAARRAVIEAVRHSNTNIGIVQRGQNAWSQIAGVREGPNELSGYSFPGLTQIFERDMAKDQALRDRLDPIGAAGRLRDEQIRGLRGQLAAGDITEQDFKTMEESAKRAFTITERAVNQSNVAIDKYTKGVGFARHEMVNLGRQAQDVFVSLGSGQSLGIVALQQGTQILDIFATSEATIGSFFKMLGGWTARFLFSPAGAIAGITGLAVAMEYLRSSYADGQRAIAGSLMGIGGGSGQTVGGINSLARSTAGPGGTSVGTMREILSGYAGTGMIGPDIIGRLGQTTRNYSILTGQDIGAATKELGGAFTDPAKGAELLNQKLGFLNDKLREFIRISIESGNAGAAQQVLLNATERGTANAQQKLSIYSKVGNATWNSIKDFFGGIGESADQYFNPDLDENIRRLGEKANTPFGTLAPKGPALRRQDWAEYSAALRERRDEQDAAEWRAADVKSNNLSIRAGEVIRNVVDDIGRLQSMNTRTDLLDKLLKSADAMRKMGVTADEVRQAEERVNAARKAFLPEQDRIRQDAALGIAQTEAYTLAERAAIDAEKARLEAVRNFKGETIAAIEAENARNRAIADANRQLRDGARDAREAAMLVGMRPYQRTMKEIELQENRRNETLLGAGGITMSAGAQMGAGLLAYFDRIKKEAAAFVGGWLPGGGAADTSGRVTIGAVGRGALPVRDSSVKISGLDSEFARKLSILLDGISGAQITSGFRDYADQVRMRAKYGAGAALPGQSLHEDGRAADVIGMSLQAAQQRNIQNGLGLRIIVSNGGAIHVEDRGARTSTMPNARVSPVENSANQTRDQRQAAGMSLIDIPQRNLMDNLREQEALLERQRQGYLGSADAMAGAAARQQLLNQYMTAGVLTGKDAEANWQRIVPLIDEYGRKAEDVARKQRELNLEMRQIEELKGLVTDSFKGFYSDFKSALDAGKSGWEALGQAASNTLNRIADKLIQMQIDNLFAKAFGGGGAGPLGSIASFLFGGGSLGSSGAASAGALSGGAFSYGTPMFARGGVFGAGISGFSSQIVNRPTVFPFARGIGLMGEAGPEAVMPLRRDPYGRLGVSASNDNNGGGLTINWVNNGTPAVMKEKKEEPDGRGGRRLTVVTEDMVASAISRPGSSAQRAQSNTFGARKRLVRG